MINVLADQYLYNIRDFIPDNINLIYYDPTKGMPSNLEQVHAMLIRTVTTINEQTLSEIPDTLQFIGTASAGSDHVNINYLRENEITFSNSAGCNARSVAEYVASALLLWSEEKKKTLTDVTVGVIGVGNVGTQLLNLLDRLDVYYTCYDPPREIREPDFKSSSIQEVLDCDILTFHTPLTKNVKYPTHHWLDDEKLRNRQFKLILNTARGGVIDEQALLKAKNKGIVETIIIDTWEHEPNFSLNTAEKAFIKTPHIAGYSEQAKNNATEIVVNAMLDHFDLSGPTNPREEKKQVFSKEEEKFDSLSSLLTELHPIKKYEAELIKIIKQHPDERGRLFNKLRAEYPFRNEFDQIYLPNSYFDQFPVLKALGFSEM
jgi:erythronate-4-phosphate dehydrogenase